MQALNRKERRANIKKYRKVRIDNIIHARQFLSLKNWDETDMSDAQVKDALKAFYGISL